MNSIRPALTTNRKHAAANSSGLLRTQHRVLILDEDEQLCLALRELYAEIDYSVEFELDGERGIARAEEGNYDLLILGLKTKTRDGFPALRKIRRHSSQPILVLAIGRKKRIEL